MEGASIYTKSTLSLVGPGIPLAMFRILINTNLAEKERVTDIY